VNLHRSITFWSGLLVMGFVCWAWRDSSSHDTSFSCRGGYVTSANEYLAVVQVPQDVDAVAEFKRYEFDCEGYESFASPFFIRGGGRRDADLIPSDARTWKEEVAPAWQSEPVNEWALYLPYWLILLTVAAVWLLLLFMRARRRNKSVIIP
jgi:hypothetical protein